MSSRSHWEPVCTPATRAAVLLFLLVGAGGCGTIMDAVAVHYDGPHIYGGVRLYFQMSPFQNEWYWSIVEALAYLIDLPLSAVADTAFLPFTIPYELIRE